MNIKDLIEKLKSFPADAQVLVEGYEGGYDDIIRIEEKPVVKNANANDWDDEYDATESSVKERIKAVVISGNRRQFGVSINPPQKFSLIKTTSP